MKAATASRAPIRGQVTTRIRQTIHFYFMDCQVETAQKSIKGMKRNTIASITAIAASRGTVQYIIVKGNTIVSRRKHRIAVSIKAVLLQRLHQKSLIGAKTNFFIIFLIFDSVTHIGPNLHGSTQNRFPHRQQNQTPHLHEIYQQPAVFYTHILHFGHLLQFLFFGQITLSLMNNLITLAAMQSITCFTSKLSSISHEETRAINGFTCSNIRIILQLFETLEFLQFLEDCIIQHAIDRLIDIQLCATALLKTFGL